MKSTTSLKAVTREVSYFSKMLSIIGPTLCARRVASNVENASNRILVLRAKVSGTAVWPKKKIYYKLLKGNMGLIGPTLCARRVASNVENASNRILVLRAKVSGTAVWPKKKIYYKLLKGNMGLRVVVVVVLTSEETISARGQSVFFSFK